MKGSAWLRVVPALAAILLLAVPARQAETVQHSRFKILYVMSYHSPWRWTDGQFAGFKEAMTGVAADYRVFQLDAKRHSSAAAIESRGAEARALIEAWKPDLIYTSDDEAQRFVARHYVGTATPIVFSGVNKNPADYGFTGSPNVTGVLEEEHFVESLRLLRAIVPGARRIAVVFDEAPIWESVRGRMQERIRQMPDMAVTAWDTIATYEAFQRRILAYPEIADAIALIGIFNFKDEQGRDVRYEDVLRWTAENSRLPDFSFWIDRVHYGTLLAVTVSEREQGLAAGRIARAILAEGRRPSEFPMNPTLKGVPVISLARAQKLGLQVTSGVLLSAEVIRRFEWEK